MRWKATLVSSQKPRPSGSTSRSGSNDGLVASGARHATTRQKDSKAPPARIAAGTSSLLDASPLGRDLEADSPSTKPSIAVLPFQNMSGDSEQDYFADGVVEEITTALSRFRQLFIIARNSSFSYKGRAVDVKEVGREL